MCVKAGTIQRIDYGFNAKTLDISAMSLHRVLATAMKLDAINEWGSVVALTYIASQRVFPDIMKWPTQKPYWKVWPAVLDIIMG
jgi:enoyl-[acyl-carrier protein] reductase I